MGLYTCVRFKGYVKPEFRDTFGNIAINGEWENSSDSVFINFGKISRTSCIPCGYSSYLPDEWETDYINKNGEKEIEFFNHFKQIATDGFERMYDKETGYWSFQCSLKNYQSQIEQWFDILPYFIEKIYHLECFYEECDYSIRYDLVDGIIQEIDDKFIEY